MSFYPNIKEDQILTMQLVVKSMEKDLGYIDRPECPYSEVIKAFFRSFGVTPAGGTSPNLFEGREDVEVIDEQIQRVLSDLEGMASQMAKAETNERLAYFKAKTVLLEKLVNMKERVFNLKEMNDFRNIIIATIEQVSTKDQVSEFMKRLDGILGVNNE